MDILFDMLDDTMQINQRSKMDSGLLSTFHDDQFDGNYSKYENNLDLWSNENDGMGLQLAETLHGILPNDEAQHFFETDIESRIPCRFDSVEGDGLTATIIEMDNYEDEEYLLTNYDAADDMSDSMSPSIEIISVDPNCEFSSPVTIDEDDDDGEETDSDGCSSSLTSYSSNSSIADYESHTSDESDIENDVENNSSCNPLKNRDDNMQQIKGENFVESSSIPMKLELSSKSLKHGARHNGQQPLNSNGIFYMPKTIKTENDQMLASKEINVERFDLAAFITQDNYSFPNSHSNHVNKNTLMGSDKIKSECDSETEAIIDIETVHDNEEDVKPMLLRKQIIDYSACMDVNEGVTQCDDDIKHDPSWCPKNEKSSKTNKPKVNRQGKNKKSNNNQAQEPNRLVNTIFVPKTILKKSYVVMDRKKYGLGKGKNISMCTNPEMIDSPDESVPECNTDVDSNICKKEELENREIKSNCAIDYAKTKVKLSMLSVKNTNRSQLNPVKDNIPQNLIPTADIKVESDPTVEVKNEKPIEIDTKINKTGVKNIPEIINSDTTIDTQNNTKQHNAEVPQIVPVKKKLNLEEYKRRRENQLIGDTKIKKTIPCRPAPIPVPVSYKKDQAKTGEIKPSKPNAVVSVENKTKSLLLPLKQNKEFYDPILEAKNKVLRMQELKKAAISKRIDSTVSAKVGPITPILPLEQICGNGKTTRNSNNLNPEYEEIIIVSASSNTEITLPPVFEKLNGSVSGGKDNPLTAVIESSSLLSNINKGTNKAIGVKISSNSLLSSIQDVVLKQSTTNLLNGGQVSQKSPNIGVSPPSQFSPQKPEMSHTELAHPTHTKDDIERNGKEFEHGEDKIIMHLRKDRIRKKMCAIAIQTDDFPQFPPLNLLLAEKLSSTQCSNTKKRKRHYRSRRNSSATSDDRDDDYRSSSRSHVRYHSISSHGTNRSISPRSSRYSYSSGRRTASPYHKVRRRSSRSSSRTKYASDSSTNSSDSGRRSRSRERRTRRYSSSHSSSSRSSSTSDNSSRSRSRSRSSRSRSQYMTVNPPRSFRRNSSPAVEERRIVYVGRIERETSKEDLKRKFSAYGPIKQITVHYKDTGMKYGFVTFEKAQDAYQVIDRSLNDSRINMYDISFGGRRAFCRQTYSDLDGAATNSFQDLPYSMAPRSAPPTFQEDSFESLLAKVKEKLSSARPSTSPPSSRCKT